MLVQDAVRDLIASVDRRFCEAFRRGAAGEVAALYTADAVLLPPGGSFVRGFAGIEAFWQGAIDMGIEALNLETMELDVHDETAIEMGRYTLLGPGGDKIDEGKFLVVWHRDHDMWKLHRDIWNSAQ